MESPATRLFIYHRSGKCIRHSFFVEGDKQIFLHLRTTGFATYPRTDTCRSFATKVAVRHVVYKMVKLSRTGEGSPIKGFSVKLRDSNVRSCLHRFSSLFIFLVHHLSRLENSSFTKLHQSTIIVGVEYRLVVILAMSDAGGRRGHSNESLRR